ncbi:MAG TPA: aromatic ring-hydroxylating dioxygenase subunit alpha [Pirellulales bacterium]|nr:aromatic ring-hydroxylating dioxygenase subunit alpha [Pirellulales bacterium]
MFLKNYWYAAAASGELGRDLFPRMILGTPVVMYRTTEGKPVAMRDACPHRSYPLSRGKLDGDRLQCCYHGLVFDPTGSCVHIPGQDRIPPRIRAVTYPVVEKWNWVWIWMGEPAKANIDDIPDMHWNDDAGWARSGGHLEINCHYQLLVDNLLDLSHAAYVHPTTIGDVSIAETPPNVHSTDGKVVLERSIYNVAPPPFFTSLHGYDGQIHRMHQIEYQPPANIVILSRCVSTDGDLAKSEGALEYMVLNAITPADETRTHHFWAVNRNFKLDDKQLDEGFQAQSETTFAEDIDVLEMQQNRLDRLDRLGQSAKWVDVSNDSAGVLARRMLMTLSEENAA